MKATKLWMNGKIIMVDEQDRIAEAVAVQGNRIVAVGKDKEMSSWIDDMTEVVDLQGKTMLPGFYDSHSHMLMVGEAMVSKVDLTSPPVGNKRNVGDCIRALKEWEVNLKPDAPLMALGYDHTLMEEKRHLTRWDLDQVSTERVICVAHITGHIGYVNSKGLELLGYTKDTPSPEGGVIQKDPETGEPNGVLEESAYIYTNLFSLGEVKGTEEQIKALALASEKYASAGVTTATDGYTVSKEQIDLVALAIEQDQFKINLLYNPGMEVIDNMDQLPTQLAEGRITRGGVKLFHDGSIQSFTAYLSKPYHTSPNEDDEYRAYPTRSREKLTELITEIHKRGHQVIIHCNGDAAIADFLAAYEQVQKQCPREDARPYVLHCQMVREDQLDIMKELGINPSFFSGHIYYWGDRHKALFLGPERADVLNPLKLAMDKGLKATIHCDTPVTPQLPLTSIWVAVNRVSYGGDVIGPDQRVSVMEGIKAYTINAAYQNFEEERKGSIEVGKLADFVILGEDILTCDPMNIRDIEVMETIVGGRSVYKKY